MLRRRALTSAFTRVHSPSQTGVNALTTRYAHAALQTRDRNGHRLLYGPGSALQHDAQKRHVAVRPGHTNKICMSYFWTGP